MFIDQKAQQISLALIRISVQVRRVDLRSRLERMAFQLLEDAAGDQLELALNDLDVIKALVELGKTIYQIEPINAKIILQEADVFISTIRQTSGIGSSGHIDIEDIFAKPLAISQADSQMGITENLNIINDFESPADPRNLTNSPSGNGNGNGISVTIRKSAIIDRIRQSGKAGLKDVLVLFPDVSERTIRYDLQKLCNQGVLDRIGNGGPATYYTLKM